MIYGSPTSKALYHKYQDDSVKLKCMNYAHWTLPKLMAELSHGGTATIVERDYQEIGALLVNNLAAKLTALLFPSNRPFFGIEPSKRLKEAAKASGLGDAGFASALAQWEMKSSLRLFLNASYNQLVQAVAHLIVTGNVLLYRDSKAKQTLCYGLTSFGIRRTGNGRLADCVLREFESFAGLSREVQAQLLQRFPDKYRGSDRYDVNVEVYTRITRMELPSGKITFQVTQEIEGMAIGKPGTYPEHLCPWQAPTWSIVAGEHYGRGLVEDYAGGFASLSDKSEALALYGIAAMKFINLVQPGQGTNVEDLNNAETGEYVSGTNGAVSVQETGNGPKILAMRGEIQDAFNNLARAFMYTANTRDAERVTAFELRQQAAEANTVLGGQYSALAESFQVPTAHVLLTEEFPEALEGIITGDIVLDILAGIPALSRSTDVQNLLSAAQDAAAIVPPLLQLDDRVDGRKVMDMIYAGQSVNTTAFHRTTDEQAQYDEAKRQEQGANAQIQNADQLSAQAEAIGKLPGGQM